MEKRQFGILVTKGWIKGLVIHKSLNQVFLFQNSSNNKNSLLRCKVDKLSKKQLLSEFRFRLPFFLLIWAFLTFSMQGKWKKAVWIIKNWTSRLRRSGHILVVSWVIIKYDRTCVYFVTDWITNPTSKKGLWWANGFPQFLTLPFL